MTLKGYRNSFITSRRRVTEPRIPELRSQRPNKIKWRIGMKCPGCFNELTSLQVGNLTVDVCNGGCGGIWFDAFELQRVDEVQEVAGERLLEIRRDERIR